MCTPSSLRFSNTNAIALEVIKYKAGKQFTFQDDAKSPRKTTTVCISGVESL